MSQVIVLPKQSNKRKFTESMGATIIQRKVRARRSAGATASVNRIPRAVKSFPTSMRVKMKFSSVFDSSITAGSPTQWFWRANSPFDPDAAIGGSQPRSFTQWSQFYEKYHVVKSTCRLRLMDKDTGTSTTGTVTGLYGIALKDTAGAVVAVKDFTEDDNCKYSGYDSYHAGNSMFMSFDNAKHFGVKNLLDNARLGGTTGTTLGTSPADQAYFCTWAMQAPSTGAAAQPFMWDVMVTYDVIFTDPRDLA